MFWQEGANGIRFLVLCTLITFCTSCHLELFEHPNFQKHSLNFHQSEEFEAKIVKGIKTHGSCSWQIFKQVYFNFFFLLFLLTTLLLFTAKKIPQIFVSKEVEVNHLSLRYLKTWLGKSTKSKNIPKIIVIQKEVHKSLDNKLENLKKKKKVTLLPSNRKASQMCR